ncbi:MAG: energy transducer TonB [Prevotella sp.]|nr:energy transducer TonB [Prevotella sp.]
MMEFLIYEGKVAAALLVFYLFYRFLLKKETFHRFNRVVLVGTAVLSFLLPLCIITIHRPMETAPVALQQPMSVTELPEMELAPVVEASGPWWPIALMILFWAGVTFVLARAAISMLSIVRIIRQGALVHEEGGCKIIVTERDIDPFSWMEYIVLSRKDWELPHESILTHEKAHIVYGHSLEVLLADVLSAFQWFNPAIWMLRADLKELHEYEADDAVLRTGANIKEYQYLLIRKAVSKSGYSVANSFNHSILKNRITMMSKSKSPLSRGLRVLYLFPLVCLGIGLQAKTVYVPMDKDSEKIVSDEQSEHVLPQVTVVKYAPAQVTQEDIIHVRDFENIKLAGGENFDTAPACSENFAFWLNSRLYYPADCLYEGTLLAMFEIGTDGKVSDVKILAGVCDELNEVVAKLIGKSPVWTPAQKDGKPVATVLFQPVVFSIRTTDTASSTVVLNVRADGTIESGGKVYTVAQLKEILPSHNAGEPLTTVQIIAADDVRMGAIEDVKEELRKRGALKVQFYSSANGQEGVTRYMPPFPGADNVKKSDYPEDLWTGVKRENVFMVRINSNDKIFFGDRPRQDDEDMLRTGKDFLKARGKEARFSLTVDRGTSYAAYRHMQELLWQIYYEARKEKALEQFGRPLQELSADEQSQIYKMIPLSISETEPKGKR